MNTMLEFGYGTFLVDHWPYVIHQAYIKEVFHLNPLWQTQDVDKNYNILQADKHLYSTMNGYERATKLFTNKDVPRFTSVKLKHRAVQGILLLIVSKQRVIFANKCN